jgi:hypothetical protein
MNFSTSCLILLREYHKEATELTAFLSNLVSGRFITSITNPWRPEEYNLAKAHFHYSRTPLLRLAGFEDEDDDEYENEAPDYRP